MTTPLDKILIAAKDPRAVHCYLAVVETVDTTAGTCDISLNEDDWLYGVPYYGAVPVDGLNCIYMVFETTGCVIGQPFDPSDQTLYTTSAGFQFNGSQISDPVNVSFPVGRFNNVPNVSGAGFDEFVVIRSSSAGTVSSMTLVGWSPTPLTGLVSVQLTFVDAFVGG